MGTSPYGVETHRVADFRRRTGGGGFVRRDGTVAVHVRRDGGARGDHRRRGSVVLFDVPAI